MQPLAFYSLVQLPGVEVDAQKFKKIESKTEKGMSEGWGGCGMPGRYKAG